MEHIRKPAKTGTLLAYYSDHLELPLGPKHRFPDTKYAKNREQLMADPELQGLIEYREVTLWSMSDGPLTSGATAGNVADQVLCC